MRESLAPFRPLATIARIAFAIALLFAAAGAAHADAPAHVRVRIHPRNDGGTFVEIAITGTDAPIRLVRHVDGACTATTLAPTSTGDTAIADVACAGDVRFQVQREGNELIVRRSASATDEWTVMARGDLARAVPVTVDVQTAAVASRQ